MEKEPLISVIVPIYKVEKYIEKCVKSIINQEYQNLEIILVDDGSPDNCGKICDDYEKIDSRIKVIHKQNGGLSSARNAGIDVAKGEYIGFVDSDDFIEPFMYKNLINVILSQKCRLAVCGINYVFEDGHVVKKTEEGNDDVMEFERAITEMNTYRLFDMGAWSKLYDASLFDNIRFPEGKLSEDFYIMFKIFDRAQKVAFVSKPAYNYLQRQNSISRNVKINRDFEYAAFEQMKYLDEYYPQLSVLGHTAYASAALTVYDFYLKNNVKCPKDVLEHFKQVVYENKDAIKKAKFLSLSKKIQFYLFQFNSQLYSVFFKIFRKIKRV